MFSVFTAELIGRNVMNLVNRNLFGAFNGVLTFVLISFPASFINRYTEAIKFNNLFVLY